MTDTDTLLDRSIKHWEELCEIAQSSLGKSLTLPALRTAFASWKFGNQAVSFGWRDCPLCQYFYPEGCNDCPVKAKTNERRCVGTPYHDILFKLRKKTASSRKVKVTRDVYRLMRAELRFLKSLKSKYRRAS